MSRRNFLESHGLEVAPGQIWMRPFGTAADKPWEAEWRVMAVSEGYAMGRLKGAMPSVVAVKDMKSWTVGIARPERWREVQQTREKETPVSYKHLVLKHKPGAECVRHQDGSWRVYDPVIHIGSGKSPAAAWKDAALHIPVSPSSAKVGKP